MKTWLKIKIRRRKRFDIHLITQILPRELSAIVCSTSVSSHGWKASRRLGSQSFPWHFFKTENCFRSNKEPGKTQPCGLYDERVNFKILSLYKSERIKSFNATDLNRSHTYSNNCKNSKMFVKEFLYQRQASLTKDQLVCLECTSVAYDTYFRDSGKIYYLNRRFLLYV